MGLDVLAISIGMGIGRIAFDASVRLGASFATAEIVMQVLGFELGTGAGKLFGVIAAYLGFGLLAVVGAFMVRESFRANDEEKGIDLTRGFGLLIASLSISLDSLGVGFALPGVGIPLVPLLVTISITTIAFASVGLACGERIGERYQYAAERTAGGILIGLALVFAIQHAIRP